jgi:hypothetical protein
MTLPRPSNKPRAVIERLATDAVAQNGGPLLALWYFKYDCSGCDRRVTISKAGVIPRRARCLTCGAWTDVTAGGFMLHTRASIDVGWGTAPLYLTKDYEHVPAAAVSTEFEE